MIIFYKVQNFNAEAHNKFMLIIIMRRPKNYQYGSQRGLGKGLSFH